MEKKNDVQVSTLFKSGKVVCSSCQALPEARELPEKINMIGPHLNCNCPSCKIGSLMLKQISPKK